MQGDSYRSTLPACFEPSGKLGSYGELCARYLNPEAQASDGQCGQCAYGRLGLIGGEDSLVVWQRIQELKRA